MLFRSGRVGKLTGLAASKLGIRPLIVLKEGEIFPDGIARGRKKSLEKVFDMLVKYLKESNLHPNDCSLTVGYGYDYEEGKAYRDEAQKKLQALYPDMTEEISLYQIGATIGVHTGPHPIGFGVIKKYDR